MFALLRAVEENSSEKKDWNDKFSWFTNRECNKITTIHGEKESMSDTCSGFPQRNNQF
ncbi:hypothetical protein GUITHDRAFT_149815 [Guillardia theta CCMP2712]|uniref:Uncharacterized protein n=1 Tax=Guillardia theta (strain CCMP2712) TaxID=905079 RepID=L1K4K6_GUITC|nr:hypothetical protein GUITHDRAFT_149815 [Guillardia theta CCMP2712]EKX55527.1 hypothetical protein GUITHDRAFT_149815 [Guillardia theta CCMP2712]|eukprot:XP_005842507.1 hypothetical protein GUITHDRAFT_149815 [Guillardia theta CCMP2712]